MICGQTNEWAAYSFDEGPDVIACATILRVKVDCRVGGTSRFRNKRK